MDWNLERELQLQPFSLKLRLTGHFIIPAETKPGQRPHASFAGRVQWREPASALRLQNPFPYFTSVFSHPGRVRCEPENEADAEAIWNCLFRELN